ncbi:MAG: precorrin-6y C5,15-methyltransferase (decarboxylating) subunit CbiE [Methylococcales bacterium]|nr:precorrin-6y C5,15-methyltransferase (decarboxylating) subunit CbiE [Methylococcales bacterium]
MKPCKIMGVLDNGIDSLTSLALIALQQADLVIGAERTLALLETQISHAEKKDLGGHLKSVPDWILAAQKDNKKVVVLATGDPLFHGLASFLTKKLGTDHLEILPNVSTIALAFAKFSIPWHDAKIISIHKKDTGEWRHGAGIEHGLYVLLQALTHEKKIAIFTSPENDPARIARLLRIEKLDHFFDIYIAQNLLAEDENLIQDQPIKAIAEQSFNGNNIVILQRKQPPHPEVLFGLNDTCFKQRKPDKGLITKREVRAVSLAKMQLKADSLVWDIGAGSGSVGLEAARLCHQGYVYAIEKNIADFVIAGENSQQLHIHNYQLIHAKAPEGLEIWPSPNAIFIGGTGGELASLIHLCLQRLKTNGWLVMNFVTLENLNTALETLKSVQAYWDVVQIQASRSQPILHMNRMQAENPVWIVSAQRESQ